MKEICELNNRLLAARKGLVDVLMIQRDTDAMNLQGVPAKLRAELTSLVENIGKAIPNDFAFDLSIGDSSPMLQVRFQDGPQAMAFINLEWREDVSIVEQLDAVDWDAQREDSLKDLRIFDEMREQAPKMPSRLPSTKQLYKVFRDDIREFVRSPRRDASKVEVLLWRDDEELTQENYPDLKSLQDDLINIMPVQRLVLSVVAHGKALSHNQLEDMKRRALKELEDMPISLARALLKF